MAATSGDGPATPALLDGDDNEESSSLYIQTTSNNYVSRKAIIDGAKQVELKGRSILVDGVHIRGDLAPVRIGRYCWVDSNTLIQPPPQMGEHGENTSTNTNLYVPVSLGSHTSIGKDCVLEAAAVGSLCWIADNVKLSARSIVKDCCVVVEHTVIPADAVIPPFTFVSVSNSGRLVTTPLPPAVSVELQERAMEVFQDFAASQRKKR